MTDQERRSKVGNELQPIIETMLKGYNSENGQAMTIAQATLYVECLNKLKNLRDSLWQG